MVKFNQKNLLIYSVEALERSRNTATVVCLFSIEVITWEVNLVTASMVLYFGRNPYWFLYSVSCLHKELYSLSWTIFSSIFDNEIFKPLYIYLINMNRNNLPYRDFSQTIRPSKI